MINASGTAEQSLGLGVEMCGNNFGRDENDEKAPECGTTEQTDLGQLR